MIAHTLTAAWCLRYVIAAGLLIFAVACLAVGSESGEGER